MSSSNLECEKGTSWNDGFNVRKDCSVDSNLHDTLGVTCFIASIGSILFVFIVMGNLFRQYKTLQGVRDFVKNEHMLPLGLGVLLNAIGICLESLGITLFQLPAAHSLIVTARIIGFAIGHPIFVTRFFEILRQIGFIGRMPDEVMKVDAFMTRGLRMLFITFVITGFLIAFFPIFTSKNGDFPLLIQFIIWGYFNLILTYPFLYWCRKHWHQLPDSPNVIKMRLKFYRLLIVVCSATSGVVLMGILIPFLWNFIRPFLYVIWRILLIMMAIFGALTWYIIMLKGKNLVQPTTTSTAQQGHHNTTNHIKLSTMNSYKTTSAGPVA